MKRLPPPRTYKFFTVIILLIAALFAVSCKQFTDDLEGFLNYWTNEARIVAFHAPTAVGQDSEGFVCLPSDADAVITFTVLNPQHYDLLMPNPPATPPEKIISFPAASTQPIYNTDYTFTKVSNTELKLTFTKTFLEKMTTEQGINDLTPVITLYETTGRKFPDTYTKKIRCNTPPPAVENAVFMFDNQTASGGSKEYILCFNLPNCSGIHTDVNRIVIDGTPYNLNSGSYAITDSGGSTPANIATAVGTMKLQPTDSGASFDTTKPRSIYLKTGRKDGGAQKIYSITLKDEKGLSSQTVSLSTDAGKLAVPKAYDSYGTELPTTGTTELSVESGKNALITLKADQYIDNTSAGSGVKIQYDIHTSGTVYQPVKTDAAPVTIELPDSAGTGTTYTIKAKAQKTGDVDSDTVSWTVTVKTVPVVVIPIPGDLRSPWKQLQETVQDSTPTAPQIIKIKNTVTAINTTGSESTEIPVNRKVRIEAESGTATINAASDAADPTKQRRIFTVKNGGDVTLANLTLTGGYTDTYGGGIFIEESNAKCTLQDVNINNCVQSASSGGNYGGGAIGVSSGTLTMTSCEIKNCTAESAGAIKITGGKAELDEVTIDHCTGTHTTSTLLGAGGIFCRAELIIKNSTIQNCTGSAFCLCGENTEMPELSLINTTVKHNSVRSRISANNSFSKHITLYVSGSTKIADELYISDPISLKDKISIMIDGALSESTVASLSFNETTSPSGYKAGRVILTGSGSLVQDNHTKFKVKDDKDGGKWGIGIDGKLGMPKQTLNASSMTANEQWKKLREAVANAADGGTITINGEIKATTAIVNKDAIEIKKKLTIKGGTNAVINGDKKIRDNIFKLISGNYKLTLENIHLKGASYAVIHIGANVGSGYNPELTINTGTIIEQETNMQRMTLSNYGGTIFMNGGTIKSNVATKQLIHQERGSFIMTGGSIISPEGTEALHLFRGECKISGTARIKKQTSSGAIEDGGLIFLNNDDPYGRAELEINSNLNNAFKAVIEPKTYTETAPNSQVLTGSGVNSHHNKFTVKPNGTENWRIKNDGTLEKD